MISIPSNIYQEVYIFPGPQGDPAQMIENAWVANVSYTLETLLDVDVAPQNDGT